ncbi:MAG: PAS domain S-box protein [Pedobacter sp.]|uniref:PAS domain S-box protein n=1 Tax=Pedobacter sp. TaxID=1411316 RepID=UPI0033980AAF
MPDFEEIKQILDDSTMYYLISVGMDSNYSYVNKRYQKIFNNVHGNLVGQHYSVTMHPEDTKICQSVSEQAFMNPGKVFPAVIRKHDGDGGYVTTKWEYKAIFDKNDLPGGMFCIGHDITELVLNSSELKDTKESLTKTQYNLAEINYIQSHVVRKPLANIMGLSNLLESMDITPELGDIIGMINESAKELDQVIRDIAAMK